MSSFSKRRQVRPKTGLFRDERLLIKEIVDAVMFNPMSPGASERMQAIAVVHVHNEITKEEYKATCDLDDKDFAGRIASLLYMAAALREEVMATRERIDQLEAEIILALAEKYAGLT